MRVFLFFSLFLFFNKGIYAQPDLTCWGNPVSDIPRKLSEIKINGNTKGSSGVGSYDFDTPYPIFCTNASSEEKRIPYYIKGMSELPVSDMNPGYFILSDDLDILIKVKGYSIYHKVSFDVEAETIIHFPGGSFPDELAFLTHGNIELKLRRDLIGGAVVIPFGKKLVSNYLTANPAREYATLPLFNLISELQIILVPIVCNINDGIEINVQFNRIAVDTLSESVTSATHYKDIPLDVRCNVTLNQEVNLRLVAGTPSFSDELIATNYPDLGIAVKHKGQLLKPMGTSAVRLINGMASEVITVFPVKKKGQQLSGGEFNASATLLISLP